jgi:hypothetical protein
MDLRTGGRTRWRHSRPSASRASPSSTPRYIGPATGSLLLPVVGPVPGRFAWNSQLQ